MMFVFLGETAVSPSRTTLGRTGKIRLPLGFRQKPFDTHRACDLHRKIPAGQNLHFGVDLSRYRYPSASESSESTALLSTTYRTINLASD